MDVTFDTVYPVPLRFGPNMLPVTFFQIQYPVSEPYISHVRPYIARYVLANPGGKKGAWAGAG